MRNGVGETLKTILNSVIFVSDVFSRFGLFVMPSKVREAIGEELAKQYLRLGIPRLVFLAEIWESFGDRAPFRAVLFLQRLRELFWEAIRL